MALAGSSVALAGSRAGTASRIPGRRAIRPAAQPAGNGALAWVRTIDTEGSGEEIGRDVKFDSQGHVVAAGSIVEFWNGTVDTAFVTGRWTPSGEQLWPSPQAPLKALFQGNAVTVELDSQDNVISGGTRISGQGIQLVVTKRRPDGTELWTKGVGGSLQSSARGMQIGVDGNDDVFAVGVRSTPSAWNEFYVVKLRGTTGEVVWERSIDDTDGIQEGHALVVDADGNLFVGGTLNTADDDAGFRVLKLSGDTGATVWSQAIDGEGLGGAEGVNSLALDAAGNVVAGGMVINNSEGGFMVAKLDGATGTPLWTRFINHEEAFGLGTADDVAVDPQGNVVAVGTIYGAGGRYQFTLVKLNGQTGGVLWSDLRLGVGTSVALDATGNVYATGSFYTAGANAPQILGAWKSTGEFNWSLTPSGDNDPDFSLGQKVAVDGAGNLAVTGYAVSNFSREFMVAYVDRVSPTVSAETTTPETLPSTGGTISFRATAADNTGLQKVVAVVTRPGQVMETSLQSNGQGGYTGQLTLPKNTTVSDQIYTTQVVVTDLSGNVNSSGSGSVTVRNGAGRLVVSPKSIQFPRTEVGTTTTRKVTLRNTGKGIVSCSVTATAPFQLQAPGGAWTTVVMLELAPGAKVQLPVSYSPAIAGIAKSVLEVASTDPRHPKTRVTVKGKAK